MERQRKRRVKKRIPRVREEGTGSGTVLVTEFSTPSSSSSDSNIILNRVQLDRILLPRYRKRNLIKTTCVKPKPSRETKNLVRKKHRNSFPRTVPKSMNKQLQFTRDSSSTLCETPRSSIGNLDDLMTNIESHQHIAKMHRNEYTNSEDFGKELEASANLEKEFNLTFSGGYSNYEHSRLIEEEKPEHFEMDRYRTYPKPQQSPKVDDEMFSKPIKLKRYCKSAHFGEFSKTRTNSSSRSLPLVLGDYAENDSKMPMTQSSENAKLFIQSEKIKMNVDLGVAQCLTPLTMMGDFRVSSKDLIEGSKDTELLEFEYVDQHSRSCDLEMERIEKLSRSSTRSLAEYSQQNLKKSIDSMADCVNLTIPRSLEFAAQVAPNGDDFKPIASTRRRISPFLREPSTLLKNYHERFKEDEYQAGTANPRTSSTYTSNAYAELVGRIRKVEILMDKQGEYTSMSLDVMRNRLSKELESSRSSREQLQDSRSDLLLMGNRQNSLVAEINQYIIFYSITTVLGFFIIIFTYSWLSEYLGGFNIYEAKTLRNWHPLLMIAGLLFLNSQSTLVFRTFNYLTPSDSKKLSAALVIHVLFQILAFVFCFLSMTAIFKTENEFEFKNLYTLHSWIGLGTLGLYLAQLLSGVLLMFPKIDYDMCFTIHIVIGNICFIFIIATCLLGFQELAWWTIPNFYAEVSFAAYFINFLGGLIVLFGGLVIFLTQEKRE